MKSIPVLKPNVTREQALHHFTRGTYRVLSLFHGRALSIAELYIPFRLFEVTIMNDDKKQTGVFSIDAVQGVLDLYQFPTPPATEDLISVETRNVLPGGLDRSQLRDCLLARVRRVVFARGFFRLREVRFDAQEIAGEIYIPYWICFRGPDGQVRISVLDAVRRSPEGAKARHLIESWLNSSPLNPCSSMSPRVPS